MALRAEGRAPRQRLNELTNFGAGDNSTTKTRPRVFAERANGASDTRAGNVLPFRFGWCGEKVPAWRLCRESVLGEEREQFAGEVEDEGEGFGRLPAEGGRAGRGVHEHER